MARVKVKLSRKYSVHDKVFDEIELREPTYREIFMDGIGKPQEWQHTQHGPMLATYPDIVDAYLQRIIVEPGYDCIGELSATDSVRLEKAVFGFFLELKTLEKSPTGSSSDSDGAPAT